jgi:hypothetical protein
MKNMTLTFSCYMELHETAWNCIEWHETAWNSMESVFMQHMELHGMCFHAAWNCMDFHGVGMKPWTFATVVGHAIQLGHAEILSLLLHC